MVLFTDNTINTVVTHFEKEYACIIIRVNDTGSLTKILKDFSSIQIWGNNTGFLYDVARKLGKIPVPSIDKLAVNDTIVSFTSDKEAVVLKLMKVMS